MSTKIIHSREAWERSLIRGHTRWLWNTQEWRDIKGFVIKSAEVNCCLFLWRVRDRKTERERERERERENPPLRWSFPYNHDLFCVFREILWLMSWQWRQNMCRKYVVVSLCDQRLWRTWRRREWGRTKESIIWQEGRSWGGRRWGGARPLLHFLLLAKNMS